MQSALIQSGGSSKLYIADTFQGVVKAGSDKDTRYQGGEHSDASIDQVAKLFLRLNMPLPDILVGTFPDDHPEFKIPQLSFVHCDVDAYKSTKDIVEWCLPRLRLGGMVVFDDYGFRGCEGVTRYVNELVNRPSINSLFTCVHNLNGHAILIRSA